MESLPITADDYLMSSLSPKELNCFAQTSKTQLERVSAFKRRAFNIETLLKKYFTNDEVVRFRQLQSQTHMIISGSTALQFFDLTEYLDSDLDLYVERSHKEVIFNWLLQIGYSYEPENILPPLTFQDASYEKTRGVAKIYNFRKHNPEQKIQLMTCVRAPIEAVLNFHSTCVMNVITHEKAYALYPKATFEERRSLVYSADGARQAACAKYASRGWAMVQSLTRDEVHNATSSLRRGPRYVGDKLCWSMEIHPKLDLPKSFIETNSWTLRFNDDLHPNSLFPIMGMMLFRDPKLLLSYTFALGQYGYYTEIRQALNCSASVGKLDAYVQVLLRQMRLNGP